VSAGPSSCYGTIIGLIFALVHVGCESFGQPEDEPSISPARVTEAGHVQVGTAQAKTIGLLTAVIKTGTLTEHATRFGTISVPLALDHVLVAPMEGQVVALTAKLGQKLAPNDPILVLAPALGPVANATLKAQRVQLEAQRRAALARLVAQKAEAHRVSQLLKDRLTTRAALAQAKATVAAERATARGLAQAVSALDQPIEKHPVTADLSGTLTRLDVRLGQFLRRGDPIGRVIQPGPRFLDLAVPADSPPGQSYTIRIADTSIPGTLTTPGTTAKHGLRTDRLTIAAEPSQPLLPGERVMVQVGRDHQGLILPSQAIVRDGPQRLCFVLEQSGDYAPHRVEVSARIAHQVVIADGLHPGDRVVVQGAPSLLEALRQGRPDRPPQSVLSPHEETP